MRVLLDQSVPKGLAKLLLSHSVVHTSDTPWGEMPDGQLLAIAEQAGFEVLITADKNIPFQQNLSKMKLALVVLPTNHWPTIDEGSFHIELALLGIEPGKIVPVKF